MRDGTGGVIWHGGGGVMRDGGGAARADREDVPVTGSAGGQDVRVEEAPEREGRRGGGGRGRGIRGRR